LPNWAPDASVTTGCLGDDRYAVAGDGEAVWCRAGGRLRLPITERAGFVNRERGDRIRAGLGGHRCRAVRAGAGLRRSAPAASARGVGERLQSRATEPEPADRGGIGVEHVHSPACSATPFGAAPVGCVCTSVGPLWSTAKTLTSPLAALVTGRWPASPLGTTHPCQARGSQHRATKPPVGPGWRLRRSRRRWGRCGQRGRQAGGRPAPVRGTGCRGPGRSWQSSRAAQSRTDRVSACSTARPRTRSPVGQRVAAAAGVIQPSAPYSRRSGWRGFPRGLDPGGQGTVHGQTVVVCRVGRWWVSYMRTAASRPEAAVRAATAAVAVRMP
jgi:hypothetical protein